MEDLRVGFPKSTQPKSSPPNKGCNSCSPTNKACSPPSMLFSPPEESLASDPKHSIFNLKFSDLPSSGYGYFLYGFQDEADFEEFKQDLKDFQRLKRESNNTYDQSNRDSNGSGDDHSDNESLFASFYGDSIEDEQDVKDDLELICSPINACKTRRKQCSGNRKHCGSVVRRELKQKTPDRLSVPNQNAPNLEENVQAVQQVPNCCEKRKRISVGSPNLLRKFSDGAAVKRPNSKLGPDSFGLRADFDRRSGLFGFERRSGLRSSINDILMDFVNGEHFQEFDRVYETINNRRMSQTSDLRRRLSSMSRDTSSDSSSDTDMLQSSPESDEPSIRVDDIFADFFDNDEDFIAFEREFEKFRANRRSNLYGSLSSMGSSRDIFGDVKSYCSRSLGRANSSSSLLSANSCSSQGEAAPSCPEDEDVLADGDHILWRSVEDWEKMLKKMRRNSKLLTDLKKSGPQTTPRNHQRRSSFGLSDVSQYGTEPYYKTQSMADLSMSDRDQKPYYQSSTLPSRRSIYSSPPQRSQSVNRSTQPSSSTDVFPNRTQSCQHIKGSGSTSSHLHTLQTSPSKACDKYLSNQSEVNSSISNSNDNNNNAPSWSHKQYNEDFARDEDESFDDNRYSSSSTLCSSNNDDLSCGLSCSCCSDLHIEEDSDDEICCFHHHLPHKSEPSPDSRCRSHSLVELGGKPQHKSKEFGFHASSFPDGLKICDNLDPDKPDSHENSPDVETFFYLSEQKSKDIPSKMTRSCTDSVLQELQTDPKSHSDDALPYLNNLPRDWRASADPLLDTLPENQSSINETPTKDSSPVYNSRSESEDPHQDSNRSSGTYSTGRLSDVDSDDYDTAKSDLSDQFSTAKSDLSGYVSASGVAKRKRHKCWSHDQRPEGSSPRRSHSVDFAGLSSLDSGVTSASDHNSGHCQALDQGVPCHDVVLRRDTAGNNIRERRAKSATACQYTCHQHCKPMVSLNCKSVSEDGIDISGSTPGAASPPTGPPGSRPPLESSMSLDSMRVRPGVARNINNSSPIAGVTSPHISTNTHTRGGSPVTVGRQSPAGHARLGRSASDGHVVVPPQALASVPGRPVAVVDPVLLDSPLHRPQHIPHPSSTQTAASSSPLHHIQQQQQQEILDPSLLPPPPSAQCSDSWRPPVISEEVVSGSSVSSSTSQGGEVHTAGTTDSQLPIDRHIDLHPDLPTEKDETDSGYRSGTIPDEKLPKVPSQATLDRQELKRKVAKFNHFVPAAALEVTGKESFQGFLKVTMNLIRPITMELGARPPSIYELLTREHIIEENTQQVAFYMPRDTHKSLHIDSETTTKEVISSLLKKFHILDHPRKFAMYEQEFNDKNKLVRLRRLTDKDYPLLTLITWDPERIRNYRMVLQENETGEIVWDAFSLPELNNFLKVLDREEKEMIHELRHKYVYMRQVMEKRLVELKNQRRLSSKSKA